MERTERIRLVAAVAGGLVVLAVFDVALLLVPSTPLPRSLATLLPNAVPAAATLWLAARWPRSRRQLVPALLVVDAVSLLSSAVMILRHGSSTLVFTESAALLAMLYAVARWLGTRRAVPLGVLTALAVCLLPVRFTSASSDLSASIAMALVWGLGGIAAATLGAYLRHQDGIRRRAVRDVRSAQRLELARDLHDFVAHHVSGIVVTAQASRIVAEHDPAQAVEALARIETAGQQALASMRRTVGMLRQDGPGEPGDHAPTSGVREDPGGTAARAPTPGIADLTELVERFTASGGTPVTLDVAPGVDDRLPPEVTTSAYRIVLEALTNVRRHAAAATRARVRLVVEDAPTGGPDAHPATGGAGPGGKVLRVTIHDDARPAPPGASGGTGGGGFGLVGLDERVAAVGGVLTAGPHDGGWSVDAVLPLPAEAAGPTRPTQPTQPTQPTPALDAGARPAVGGHA